MRTLVLGGYGAVGAQIVAQLRAEGDIAFAAGRDAARADRVIDLGEADAGSLRAALADVDVVVNASGVEDPALAAMITAQGVAFVDITATSDYVYELERLDPPRPVLISVGLAPGLTNLLAAAVHAVSPGPIDIVVLLGAGERHGAAATAWSYSLLGRRFRDSGDDRAIRNYTRPRLFDLPGYGRRRVYRTDFSGQHTLTRDLRVPVRTYFGLDSRLATALLATLTWLPGATRAPQGLHLPGSDCWLVLARNQEGRTRWADGRIQSNASAVVAAMAARVIDRLPPGVHHLHQVLTLADLPSDRGISLGGRQDHQEAGASVHVDPQQRDGGKDEPARR